MQTDMAEETIQILKVDTLQPIKSIGELRQRIKDLKDELNGMTIGSKDYSETLQQLTGYQTALKNAMHATNRTGEDQDKVLADLTNAAAGATDSYNGLVRQTAKLTEEYRATTSEFRRKELGKEIKEINEELKKMDAARGIYSRNVGDYFNQLLPGLQRTKDTLGLIGKQPVLGLVMLLQPVLSKIVDALKDNETALGAIDKLLEGLKPVTEFLAGIIEKIAGWLSDAVEWVLQLAKDSGISFNKIVAGAVGVGNALKEFLLIPIRNVIDGAKGMGKVIQDIFTGKFKQAAQDAKQAVKDIGDNFKKGFDFKGNYQAGVNAGEVFVSGLKSKKVKESAKGAGQDVMKAFLESLENEVIEEEDLDNVFVWDPEGEARKENQALLDELIRQRDEYDAEMAKRAEWEKQAAESAAADDKKRMKERMDVVGQYLGAVSNVFDAVADIYEADGEASEASAKKAKALRTASAIISTITGAVSAYMNTIESIKNPVVSIPLAALNAASVLAAGYAQVKQINAVKVGSGGGASGAVQAPAFSPALPQTRNVTSRSETERLNRIAEDQRVYLVYSDLEVANTRQRVRVQETEF